MSSNLSCIGFDAGGDAELRALLLAAPLMSTAVAEDDVEIKRWQDPSGARLIVVLRGSAVVDLLPSFAGLPGVRLSACHPLNAEVVSGQVVDEHGEQITAMAFELEQRRGLDTGVPLPDAWASVVGFGHDVTIHASESEFGASRHSLMNADSEFLSR